MNIFKKYKKIIIIALVLIIIFVAYTQISASQNKSKTGASFSDKYTIKLTDLKKAISASGKIQSNSVISLKFQTSGLLTYVGVRKGDLVKKGELIASLDQRELEKTLKKDLNDYMTSRWSFEEDKQETYKNKALTNTIQRALDKNQFALDNTVLDVEITDIALKFSKLYSPIDGVIIDVDAPLPGVNITAGTATFTIADYNDIYFIINVDEADIGKIEIGQLVDIKLDAYENQTFPGVINKIGFTSTTTSSGGTAFPVEVKFPDNSNLRFKIGMNGDAEIILNTIKNTIAIANEFLFEDGNTKYVWKLNSSGTPEKKIVRIGLETDDKTEIISGLKENDKIVIPKI
jgi:HlyD family secretion protein